jgi:hypothetical protein
MTGYTDDELRTRTPAVHLGEETFARIGAELESKGSYRGEHISRSKSGVERVIELTAFTVRNGAGEAVCHVGIKRDIGERKRAENEIRERVRQQAAVAELGRQALSGRDIASLMRSAADLLASALPADLTVVFEAQPDGQHLLVRAGYGCEPGKIEREVLPVSGESAAGYAFRHIEPVIIEDLETETRFVASGLRRYGVTSGMYVVIEGRERPLGILGAHTRTRRSFTVNDVRSYCERADAIFPDHNRRPNGWRENLSISLPYWRRVAMMTTRDRPRLNELTSRCTAASAPAESASCLIRFAARRSTPSSTTIRRTPLGAI